MRAHGLKIGLVSNTGRPIIEKTLSAIGLALEQFDVVVISSDAKPKPSPEPFLIAIQRVGSGMSYRPFDWSMVPKRAVGRAAPKPRFSLLFS